MPGRNNISIEGRIKCRKECARGGHSERPQRTEREADKIISAEKRHEYKKANEKLIISEHEVYFLY